MAEYRKLGRPSDQRRAILRNLTTTLLWKGSITTTMDRAKEVRSIAEKLITLAVKEHKNTIEVDKAKINDKGEKVTVKVTNDMPSRLAARRKLMSYLYEMKQPRNNKESKMDYYERTKDVKHPLIEKMFAEIGPKYDQRNQDKASGGGYTRIIKKGPRRGDAAEMVILQLVD